MPINIILLSSISTKPIHMKKWVEISAWMLSLDQWIQILWILYCEIIKILFCEITPKSEYIFGFSVVWLLQSIYTNYKDTYTDNTISIFNWWRLIYSRVDNRQIKLHLHTAKNYRLVTYNDMFSTVQLGTH